MKDYYKTLGLEKFSSIEKVKQAYFALSSQYHPDSQKHLPSEIRSNPDLYLEMTEAYNILKNRRSKRNYDEELQAKGAPAKKDLTHQAEEAFNEGKKLFDLHNSKALVKFRKALTLNSEVAKYHAYLGKALLSFTNNTKVAIKCFEEAAKLEPNNADYLVNLGYAHKKLGNLASANQNFKAALKINPYNHIIEQEIHNDSKDNGKSSSTAGKRFMDRIFG